MLAHKAIAACGTTPENVAKMLMIHSTLGKKGGNPIHIAAAMKNLGAISDELKAEIQEKILTSWGECHKLVKADIGAPVRMHLGLDNENEPSWTEVKNLKDVVGGVSPNSQEAIELNLARATKSGGLKKDDIARANIALKAISALNVDPVALAKILFMEKTICDNGVPAVEVARVIQDGIMPPAATQGLIDEVKGKLTEDLKPDDVECAVKIYNNLKFKSNCPTEVIEFVDKTLIQVRCSLEDVADNMISTMRARGEKDMKITRDVTEVLKKTGASASVVGATILPPLRDLTGKKDTELTKVIGRNLKDVEYTGNCIYYFFHDLFILYLMHGGSKTIYNRYIEQWTTLGEGLRTEFLAKYHLNTGILILPICCRKKRSEYRYTGKYQLYLNTGFLTGINCLKIYYILYTV